MNVYDAIAVIHDHLDVGDDALLREARGVCGELVDAWEALEPAWWLAPASATHCIFDPESGTLKWCAGKPDVMGNGWTYRNVRETWHYRRVKLHGGIDWRECVWARPSSKSKGA